MQSCLLICRFGMGLVAAIHQPEGRCFIFLHAGLYIKIGCKQDTALFFCDHGWHIDVILAELLWQRRNDLVRMREVDPLPVPKTCHCLLQIILSFTLCSNAEADMPLTPIFLA